MALPINAIFFVFLLQQSIVVALIIAGFQLYLFYDWMGPGRYDVYENGLLTYSSNLTEVFSRWAEIKSVNLIYQPGKFGGSFLLLDFRSGKGAALRVKSKTVRDFIPTVLPRIAARKLKPDVLERLRGKRGEPSEMSTWKTDRRFPYQGYDYKQPGTYWIALYFMGVMAFLKFALAPHEEWSPFVFGYFLGITLIFLKDLHQKKFPPKNVEAT